ncbi:MAG: hypothetical protein HY901_11210 [Deltaproteobacteria bacterium]|nr:hypothetical protein [Deltaproteobacteria bacterium]
MPALGIVGLVVFALVAALLAFRASASAAEASSSPPPPPRASEKAAVTPPSSTPLTRAQLEAKLRRLAETPPPEDLRPGAMCYVMAAQPDTADYTCPKCGQRTHYSKNAAAAEQVREIASMRAQVRALRGVDAALDESSFCSKCSGKASPEPTATLVVNLPDGRQHRTEGISPSDLQLLSEFLAGSVRHGAGQGREEPLLDSVPRIRQLLGLNAATPSK